MTENNAFQEGLRRFFWPVAAALSFVQQHFKAVVLALLVLFFLLPSGEEMTPNNLQHIQLKGPIVDTAETVKALDAACNDEAIQGVLLEIDSPGGAVAPSLEVAYAVKRIKAKKPVVVYGGNMMASGGYYAAIWADKIYANPGAIVGSIGVIMQGTDLSGIMEKIGIKGQVVSAGRYKQIGTPEREWTPEERRELTKVIQGTYDLFVGDVAAARGLDPRKHALYADAHIFTSKQAKAVGLVDEIGVMHDAKTTLIALSGVKDPVWNEEDYFDQLLRSFIAESALLLHTYFPAATLR